MFPTSQSSATFSEDMNAPPPSHFITLHSFCIHQMSCTCHTCQDLARTVGLGWINRCCKSGSTSRKDADTPDVSLGTAGNQPMLIKDLLRPPHRIASCQGILVLFPRNRFSFREIPPICPFISMRTVFF